MSADSHDLKSFILNNNIMTTMAGVTIAFSTGTMIRSLVGDIVMPALYAFINFLLKRKVGEDTAFASISAFGVDKFLKELITWILVIVLTYLFIVYIMKRYVGEPKPKQEDKKPEPVQPPQHVPVQPAQIQPVPQQQRAPSFHAQPQPSNMNQNMNANASTAAAGADVGAEQFYQQRFEHYFR